MKLSPLSLAFALLSACASAQEWAPSEFHVFRNWETLEPAGSGGSDRDFGGWAVGLTWSLDLPDDRTERAGVKFNEPVVPGLA